jgi:hypothetical protein
MTADQKIDVLKLVYTEEGENLRFETTTAQNLMRYFITVELALAAWIAGSGALVDATAKWIVFLLNLLFCGCVAILIIRNYLRRLEIVTPLRNALEALELTTPGTYLPEREIHSWRFNASWRNWYLALIALFCGAQALPIFLLPVAAAR